MLAPLRSSRVPWYSGLCSGIDDSRISTGIYFTANVSPTASHKHNSKKEIMTVMRLTLEEWTEHTSRRATIEQHFDGGTSSLQRVLTSAEHERSHRLRVMVEIPEHEPHARPAAGPPRRSLTDVSIESAEITGAETGVVDQAARVESSDVAPSRDDLARGSGPLSEVPKKGGPRG